jgi:hypothetical protein
MNTLKQTTKLDNVRQLDMVDYLYKVSHSPSKIRNCDYWYLSPLREEKNASFKVNRILNCWYDHGIGKGGNLIDFAILYHNCTAGKLLININSDFSFHKPISNSIEQHEDSQEKKIKIVRKKPLYSLSLVRYLHQRKIPLHTVEQFCKEVHYELNGKNYFEIGFKNNSGDYEIRNPYFKGSSAPKDITTFNHPGAKEACVFEGFTDFLSLLIINKNQPSSHCNFIILNSAAFFEKARSFMEQNEVIRLYLDRDATGQNYSRYALS